MALAANPGEEAGRAGGVVAVVGVPPAQHLLLPAGLAGEEADQGVTTMGPRRVPADRGRLPLPPPVGPALAATATLVSPPRTGGRSSTRRKLGQGALFFPGCPLVRPLSLLALLAGAIHAAVVPGHFGQTPVLGVLLAALAAGQLVFAAAFVLRPSPALFARGLALNVAVVLAWFASRTSGSRSALRRRRSASWTGWAPPPRFSSPPDASACSS